MFEKDDFDEFFVSTIDPDIDINDTEEIGLPANSNTSQCQVCPTTNAGDTAFTIEETTKYGGTSGKIHIAGHVLLNQCGTLLTRKKHQIKGSSRHNYFLQRICATSPGTCIPLMYPEGVLFPSIHWKSAPNNCSIIGCIPASLLRESIQIQRFASIQSHIRS